MNKQPEQTAKTRQSLIDAYWKIAEKEGLGKVTISGVTKLAGFNRGTFYVYFTDIDDLLYQAEQEIISDLRTKLLSVVSSTDFTDFSNVSSRLIEIIGCYDDKLFILLGKNGDPHFLDNVRKEASVVFKSIFKIQEETPYQPYIIAYLSSAFTGLLQYWHETGKKISLEELSGIAHGMALHGAFGMNCNS